MGGVAIKSSINISASLNMSRSIEIKKNTDIKNETSNLLNKFDTLSNIKENDNSELMDDNNSHFSEEG